MSTLKGFDKNSNNFQQDDWGSAYYKQPGWKKPKQYGSNKRGHFYRVAVVLLILAAFFTIRGTSSPWGVQVRENLKYVLTTEWNYQPVFERVVQYGLQLTDADWPFFSSPQPVVSIVNTGPAAGSLPLPVSGQVVRNFGMVVDPLDNLERFHGGIDIAAQVGSEVRAVQDGQVKKVGDSRELGKYVLIDHGQGAFTLYGELARAAVSEGQEIKAGQTVGEVGNTGDVSGGSLHFELRENEKLVDPLSRLQINP
ncbi:MAG: M23 family metallopeptidase [Desulfotomaculaceae bacterium]|nr:M23 family metallopeptidase [Desulfotomaculaceae bacterium]